MKFTRILELFRWLGNFGKSLKKIIFKTINKTILMRLLILITLLSALSLEQTFAQTNIDSGLLAYYPFNGNSKDESSKTNDATSTDSPTLIENREGKANSAYEFDGVSEYLQVKNTRSLDFAHKEEFSISLLVKIPENQVNNSYTVNDILSKWDESLGHIPFSYTIRVNNQNNREPGLITVARYDGGACRVSSKISSTKKYNDNKWHSVVFQGDKDGKLSLYIDCELIGSVIDKSTCAVLNSNSILIGKRTKQFPNASQAFKGGVDEIRFHNRLLTSEERTAICNNTLSVENKIINTISVYPNPVSSDKINIKGYDGQLKKVTVFDTYGRKIQESTDGDISSVANGVYFVAVELSGNEIITQRIIVRR